jgi:hypothetical protein
MRGVRPRIRLPLEEGVRVAGRAAKQKRGKTRRRNAFEKNGTGRRGKRDKVSGERNLRRTNRRAAVPKSGEPPHGAHKKGLELELPEKTTEIIGIIVEPLEIAIKILGKEIAVVGQEVIEFGIGGNVAEA